MGDDGSMETELELQNKEKHRVANEPPRLTKIEEVGNAVSHGAGVLFAVVALVLMLLKSDTGFKIIASCFYGISIILLMLMSTLYHSLKGTKAKIVLRRLDYTTIYLLIGGTFAPMLLINIGGTLGVVLFCVQWGLILSGVTITAVFGPGRLKVFTQIMYFCLGWSGLMFIPLWIKNKDTILFWILAGGIIYTVGMIPFRRRGVKGMHFIWHMVCLLAVIVHWVGIYINLY